MEHGNVLSFLEKNPDHDRLGMLLEIAQGLRYLHNLNPQVIHGDIRGVSFFTFIFNAPFERMP
jgi:serine/threonine protein kinase